jgi:hypothetical protein
VSRVAEQHRWVVDSIEESVASVEVDGKKMITVPQFILPKGTREGHVLRVTIEIDEAATKQALAESAAQVAKHAYQPKDPGGDIVL